MRNIYVSDTGKDENDGLKSARGNPCRFPIVKDSVTELLLANARQHRSGTLRYLHISEYGWTCAKHPDKAREVRIGALNTLQHGQVAFVESTAEGQEGHFYELWTAAKLPIALRVARRCYP